VSALFQEQSQPVMRWSRRGVFLILPALFFYWVLSIGQAHSWKVGSVFVAVFLVSGIFLTFVGWVGLAGLERTSRKASLWPRLAFRNLSRNPFGSLSIFVALGLGTLLINLIPQVQKSLETEMTQPQVSQIPSLFLFDIQDDQVAGLQAYLSSQGIPLEAVTPLIRGRLIAVNAKAFEKDDGAQKVQTREGQREAHFRNRSFNLTYRSHLSESEKIVKGTDFQPLLQDPPEISVEQEFAKRLGLHLKDVMEFDVQGVPVRGRIVNFRKVQWASFQPNFFVQFQPGLLEGAPKTFLGSIRRLSPEVKTRLQNGIVQRFPNVSMIDISVLVEKILSIFTQMGWAMRTMAILSLFAGFVVLFSIANHQASQRSTETNLLKVLGASFRDIRGIYELEFGALALGAALCGTAGSLVMSYFLSQFLFDRIWVLSGAVPLLVTLLVPLLAVATVHAATGSVLRQKPLALLQMES
jgi:putative ABC transport system permease protein